VLFRSLDAHASYVALSRHRSGTALHYGRDDFADEAQLRRTLSRARPKDMALDYDRPTTTPLRSQPAATARGAGDSGSATPREEVRGFGALVARMFGRDNGARTTPPEAGREASAAGGEAGGRAATADTGNARANDRSANADRAADRNAGKAQAAGRATDADRAASAARDAGRSADPANSEQEKALRAMIAARASAARHTPESMREALAAAAKAAPSASREQDYGAER
jgi:hypothetical protein